MRVSDVLQVLVQRLQKDILPKIESQIAELAKQDEPNEATKAISKQLKVLTLPCDLAGNKLPGMCLFKDCCLHSAWCHSRQVFV